MSIQPSSSNTTTTTTTDYSNSNNNSGGNNNNYYTIVTIYITPTLNSMRSCRCNEQVYIYRDS